MIQILHTLLCSLLFPCNGHFRIIVRINYSWLEWAEGIAVVVEDTNVVGTAYASANATGGGLDVYIALLA